jgi:hypothetical protein
MDSAMRCHLDRVVGSAAALLIGLSAASVVAMDLVPGGYGTRDGAVGSTAPLTMQPRQFNSSAGSAGLTLDFTPRASGSLFSRPAASDEGATTSLSLGFDGSYGEGLRLDSIGLTGRSTAATDGMALGGALSVDDREISGRVGRANLLGTDADVFAAGLGYGPVNARLVYGQLPQSTSGVEGDLLMFSTDLAAWSNLTLQGDVAVSDTLADEPLTVGRIGLRLNF